MKKLFDGSKKSMIIMLVILLVVGAGCFAAGNAVGYDSGKKSGEKIGLKAGEKTGNKKGYKTGYEKGLTEGEELGYATKLEEANAEPNKFTLPDLVGKKLGDVNVHTTLGGYVFLSFKEGDKQARLYISTESTDGEKVNWSKKMSYVITKQSIAPDTVFDITKNFTKSDVGDYYESNEKLVLTCEKKASEETEESSDMEVKAFDIMEESVVGEDGIAPGTYVMTTDASSALVRIDDADGNRIVYENMESVKDAKENPSAGFLSEKTVILKAGYKIYPDGSTLHFEPKK